MMVFYDYIWQVCPDTGRSTGAYVVFYQGVPIDHYTHVPGTVAHLVMKVSIMQHALQ